MSYPFSVVKYGPLDPTQTVTVSNGAFLLGGKEWRPLGMNYWSRYSTALDSCDSWGYWLSPEQYNPALAESDLALAHRLGMNTLSIAYERPDNARSLMDFMERARRHDIKLVVYMPGLHPLQPNFELSSKLIVAAHLPESPALFAYDLGWEVHVGKQDARSKHNGRWSDWVVDRYGSIESAEGDWEFKPERVGGKIVGPSDEQISSDGAWRVYVAAYRRFWDDEISRRYRLVKESIGKLDTAHLLGARSGYGGTGSKWVVPQFPFDLASGAKHLDFTSPEGYALGGDRTGFLKGGFCTLYGRFVSGGKPVYWAEYGVSIWPKCDSEAMERQRDYFAKVLEMTYLSRANGSAGWWWPGGFRLGEDSDFGLINPDGTPRPAASEFAKHAALYSPPPPAPKAGETITIDRDKYVTGFEGIYSAFNEQVAKALDSGEMPTLRTDGTATNSANCPLVAVGNKPYNGSNPPKHLNAEFNYLLIDGRAATDGDTIEVESGRRILVEASVGNIAEATWLAPGSTHEGAVFLVADAANAARVLCPIGADTQFLGDVEVAQAELTSGITTETTFAFRMTAKGRADFGEVVRVTLKPK